MRKIISIVAACLLTAGCSVNPVTGKDEEPDVELMKSVENKLDVDNADTFRNELLSTVAAWAIDHPEQEVEYEQLYPRYIRQLRQAYFEEHQVQIGEIGRTLLAVLDNDDSIDPDDREQAQSALNVLKSRYGYERSSAKIATNWSLSQPHWVQSHPPGHVSQRSST